MADDPQKQAGKPGVSPISGTAPPKEYQFKPGQSGNPGGRPKGASITAAIRRALARDPEKDGIGKLAGQIGDRFVDALNETEPERAVALLKEVLDRVDGKVTEKVEQTVQGQYTVRVVRGAGKREGPDAD